MKKMIITVLSVMFVLLSVDNVYAEEPLQVYMGEAKAENNVLQIQFGTNLENNTEEVLYKVTLGDDELAILSVSDYDTEELNTSYAFLVDVSGSIKQSEMDNMKSIMKNVITSMDEGDNAVIMRIGNDAYMDGLTFDKEQLLQQVDEVEILKEDTNLYYGISKAIDYLTTMEDACFRKCIVIMSDGQDDQISGITQKEVEDKINAANIPVCTVAITGAAKAENAKVMGSFARMSPGGIHMIWNEAGIDAEGASNTIVDVSRSIVLINADISDYSANGTENFLQVEASVDGKGTASDGYNVKSITVSEGVVKVEEPEVTENPVEESVSESVEEEVMVEPSGETEENRIGRYVIVGSIIVVLLIIVWVVVRKKKKDMTEEELEEETGQSENAEQAMSKEESVEDEKSEEMIVTQEVVQKPTLEIKLAKIGNVEDEVITLQVVGELVIGRKHDGSDVCFENDPRLSGRHCKFTYNGTDLILEDLHSLNGTLVNGVPISQPYYLSQDEIICIGSMEWRVFWENQNK